MGSGCSSYPSIFGDNGFKLLLESDRMKPDAVNAREKRTVTIEGTLNNAYDTAYEFQNIALSWIPSRHV